MMYQAVEFRGLTLRTVPPYFHVIYPKYKPAWRNRTLGELFADGGLFKQHQFGAQRGVECGLVKINYQRCTLDDVVRLNDVLSFTMHRHEPPVLYKSAGEMIVFDDGDVVVVDKPSTVPIHATGAYNHNSVVSIFKYELGMDIKPIHRLDRLVSGLVVFSRQSATAKRLSNCLSQTHAGSFVKKSYLAKVHGRFPGPPYTNKGTEDDRWLVVSVGIRTVDEKTSEYECNDELGKESISRFALLRYCALTNTSLVQCEPLTGRTHQLRLHLQHVGHAIVNDPIYGPQGKLPAHIQDEQEEQEYAATVEPFDISNNQEGEREYGKELCDAVLEACEGCKKPRRPPSPLGIWLHSMRFKVYERNKLLYAFTGPFPDWARNVEEEPIQLIDDDEEDKEEEEEK